MTTLKSRLSRLQAQAGAAPATGAAASAPTESGLRERLAQVRPGRMQAPARIAARRLPPEALAETLNGAMIANGLIRIEARVPLCGNLGALPLAALRDIPPLPGEAAPQPSVYLDTETTGLAGGSGTLAFLVGLAFVEQGAIRLVQLLLTRFDAEPALLPELVAQLPPGHRLASFNGKSFDVPLLRTRFRMQGIEPPFDGLAHLDLLHPARRLFGRRWDDCRLVTLERELLGFTRADDLPGAEAPEAWFGYMRAGQAAPLVKVVEHNRQDILSLAAVHRAIADAVRDPEPGCVDMHGLARWLAEESEAEALAVLERYGDHLCDAGLRLQARLLRRAGRWDRAVPLWERLAAQGCPESIERLAKYYEHVRGDFAKARHYCARLPDSEAALQRRKRLDQKLCGPVGFPVSTALRPD